MSTGLTAYWKMDESSLNAAFTTLRDTGSSPHDATYVDSPLTSPNVPSVYTGGYSIGLNTPLVQYATTGTSAPWRLYPMSYSFWIKTTSTVSSRPLGFYVSGSLNGWTCFFVPPTGKLTFYYFGASGKVWDGDTFTFVSGVVNNGAWHNIVYTLGSGGGKIYTDGVLSNSLAWTGTPSATSTAINLLIGADVSAGSVPTSGGTFSGYLKDLQIFNSELSSADVTLLQTNSTTTATPISRWKMDEANNIADSSGNGYVGTPVGSPGTTSSVPPLIKTPPAFALNLTANTMYATTNILNLFGSGDFSCSYWCKTSTSFGGVIRIIGNYVGGNTFWGTGFNGSNQIYAAVRDSTNTSLIITSTLTYNDGAWHNIIINRTSSTLTLYVDGASVASASGTTVASVDNTQTYTIGRDIVTGTSSNYIGALSQMRLYNRVLTTKEISLISSGYDPATRIYAGTIYSGQIS